MSLYESLDGFVGAGVLAAAGIVGIDFPSDRPLDGAELSRHLRAHRMADGFGAALDGLAHAIWLSQEQRGFSQSMSESHALALGRLLSAVRITSLELAAVKAATDTPSGSAENRVAVGLADMCLAKIATSEPAAVAGLVPEIARFLLTEMFAEIAAPPRLLEELKPALSVYRATLLASPIAPARSDAEAAHPPLNPSSSPRNLPAPAPPAAPATSPTTAVAVRGTTAAATRAPLPGVLTIEPQPGQKMPVGAMRRFQAILAQQPMTAQQRQVRLDELTSWLTTTVEFLRRPSNASAEMSRIRQEAASALEAGDLERAMELLKSIRERLRDERRGAEARIAEELSNLRLTMLEEAAATARLGELAMARMEFAAAAEFFADAAGQLPAKEVGIEFDYRQRHAEALAALAETKGDRRVLESAAQAFRQCRRLLVRERDPASWVRASVGLGDMLMGLASGSPQPEIPLEEAVVSFAEAVEVIDPAAKPRQWGLLQLSYAAALVEYGRVRDRERHWRNATALLTAVVERLEPIGATELSEAARQRLQTIAAALTTKEDAPVGATPLREVG